jgi:hypothetical protein
METETNVAEGTKSSVRIDWIAATYPTGTPTRACHHPKVASAQWIAGTPHRGYTWSRQFVPYGVTESGHETRAEMGVHVVYSGKALARLMQVGVDSMSVLSHIVQNGGKITRLDVALDLDSSGIRLDVLQAHFQYGLCKTKARSINPVGRVGASQGTLYIGSRTSEAFMRIYDKATEQGINADWLRIELELKAGKARSMAKMLLEGDPARVIPSAITGFANWPDYLLWVEAIRTQPIVVKTDKHKDGNTRKWLIEVCAPALAKMQIVHGDEQLLAEFMAAFQRARLELQSGLSGSDETLT